MSQLSSSLVALLLLVVTSANIIQRCFYICFYVSHIVTGAFMLLFGIVHIFWMVVYLMPGLIYWFIFFVPTLMEHAANHWLDKCMAVVGE